MGGTGVLVDADPGQAHLDDPGVMLAEAYQDEVKWTRGHLRCNCRHGRRAHRHYRHGSECAVCECPRWSPWNPVPRLARLWAR